MLFLYTEIYYFYILKLKFYFLILVDSAQTSYETSIMSALEKYTDRNDQVILLFTFIILFFLLKLYLH